MEQVSSNSSDPALLSQDHNVIITGRNRSAVTVEARSTAQPLQKQPRNKAIRCRFFNTKQGCRAGDACPYLHQEAQVVPASTSRGENAPRAEQLGNDGKKDTVPEGGSVSHMETVDTTISLPSGSIPPQSVVTKPRPPQQLANPRAFEISQIIRRYSPTVRDDRDITVLVFKLVPSDPDFPFELSGNALNVTLSVPQGYPGSSQPSIRITNAEMELGYQINVQKGFDELVVRYPNKTLLELMKDLDKNLEGFLVSEKAPTIKIVSNINRAPAPPQHPSPSIIPTPLTTVSAPIAKPKITPAYTAQQLQDAQSKRETDIRQIDSRLGRQPLYSKSSDGSTFNIPLQIPKIGRLPITLQSVKDVRLSVPQLYPLEPCTIRLREGSKEAGFVEDAFRKYSVDHPELTLMAHINHMVQNMHTMAQEIVNAPADQPPALQTIPSTENKDDNLDETNSNQEPRLIDQDRPHIQLIARPPEWDLKATESDDSELSESDSSDFDSELDEDGGAEIASGDQIQAIEHGILLSFPMLELYSIELLQVTSLSLTIKCERCKETMDFMSIKPTMSTTEISRTVESCRKCASSLSIVYRSEPMHMNSIRAGFLDLEGCTVTDMLPSTFQPTCSSCSTTLAKPGVVSVRGESSSITCRECHKKMTFKLPEVKFLRISSAERPTRPLPRKKPKEKLGIVAGTELPRKGRCAHYAKSYRWFRFSCCQKVYACDRCHDAAEEHPNEHANRMICGLCSREQHYRPEDCAFCRSGLVGKRSGGFWEGGKGTRDKVKMNRKDPRKYKRRGGGAPVGGGKAK